MKTSGSNANGTPLTFYDFGPTPDHYWYFWCKVPKAAEIDAVECKSTFCRVEVSHADRRRMLSKLRNAGGPFGHGGSGFFDPDSEQAIHYFAREGHPRALAAD
jgi:hypothetical protein